MLVALEMVVLEAVDAVAVGHLVLIQVATVGHLLGEAVVILVVMVVPPEAVAVAALMAVAMALAVMV